MGECGGLYLKIGFFIGRVIGLVVEEKIYDLNLIFL